MHPLTASQTSRDFKMWASSDVFFVGFGLFHSFRFKCLHCWLQHCTGFPCFTTSSIFAPAFFASASFFALPFLASAFLASASFFFRASSISFNFIMASAASFSFSATISFILFSSMILSQARIQGISFTRLIYKASGNWIGDWGRGKGTRLTAKNLTIDDHLDLTRHTHRTKRLPR